MSIAAALAAQPKADEPKYKATTEFDGITGFIQTAPVENPPTDYDELLKFFGYDPEQVEIFGDPQTRRWQTYDERWLSYFKFTIRKRTGRATGDALIKLIEGHKAHVPVQGGPAFFNFQASDCQLGKVDNGGSDAIVGRFLNSLERARVEYLNLRKRQRIGGVHLMFPGDCIEGNQSQNGRNMWRTDLTITEQIAVFERLLYATIDAFADDTDELLLDVVNGNHDEAQRFQTTRPGDGWATHAASSVAKGLERNTAAYNHITVRTPDPEQGYMTVPAGDTIFTIAHGHQWRRNKAMDWWAGQAFHGQNPGGAQILVHGHYHTFELETTKSRTRIQSSTLDGGSNYYRESTGAESRQGALIYVTQAGLPSEISLV